jgi:two-component system sensor histidine kinase RegB
MLVGDTPAPPPTPRAANAINFSWLVRLRWGAFLGQTVTILAVDFLMGIDLPLVPLLTIVAIEMLSNIACAIFVRARPQRVEEWHLAVIMAFDIILLTGLLYVSGGPFNPFSFLYLVHIALAAVILRPGYAWPLLGLSILLFAGLFFAHIPLDLGRPDESEHELHVRGMWVAFGVASAFIVYFVQRVRRALADRDAELERQKSLSARSERLASLASLAAGAAHELSTPLSTIAVIAKEFEHDVEIGRPSDEVVSDARLIRQEVERCRAILLHLAEDAGQSTGEPIVRVSVGELVESALAEVKDPRQVSVALGQRDAAIMLELPRRAVAQALRAVLTNARHASKAESPIAVTSESNGEMVRISVEDRGQGMSAEDLLRAGEPFFTTKEPGRGMGLGLFLTRTVLERIGGRLELDSQIGRGTKAVLVLRIARDVEALEDGRAR